VDQKQGDQQTNLAGTVEGLQTIILTMIHAIDSRPVAEKAIGRLGLEGMTPAELLDNLTIEQVESTSFIVLTYESSDPVEATKIVNTVGQVSSELISERSAAGSQLTANVYEEAVVPDSPVSPDPLRNGVLAAVFGVMLGIGLALLMEYLDHSWRSPEEVEQVSGVPTFATIPEFSLTKSKRNKRMPA
jgi:capsular polysaccharide biosynthesis protein